MVKLTDISGEKLVMDAKIIVGVYEHPIRVDFYCKPHPHYQKSFNTEGRDQFHHVVYDGINVVYESIFSDAFIDSLPKLKKDFLASRIVTFASTIDEFTEFLEKALG